MTQAAELMRTGKMASKSDINKGVDIMEIKVPAAAKM